MTHTLRKTLSIVISLLLIISTFAMADFSAFAKSKDFEYYPGDNNGIMVASYKGNKAKLTIPKKIGNKKVTVLSGINNNKVKEITIGENIIHIEDFAFMDAKELEKITVNKNNKNYSQYSAKATAAPYFIRSATALPLGRVVIISICLRTCCITKIKKA